MIQSKMVFYWVKYKIIRYEKKKKKKKKKGRKKNNTPNSAMAAVIQHWSKL